jgi:hypothetical protein
MLNCQQFEELLPEVVDGGAWSAEQRAHVQGCTNCSSLVEDLRHIVQEAPQLAATDEPSPRVWLELRKSLEAEGIIRRQAKPGRLMDFFFTPRWRPVLLPLGAAAALALILVAYRSDNTGPNMAQNVPAKIVPASVAAALLDDEDVQLLNDVSSQAPSLRASYEDNLKSANAYIQDAKETVAKNPDSDQAHEDLMQAYSQKAMVYEMAMNRSPR